MNNVAQSEKISSKDYSDTATSLDLSGDILISGKLVNIASTDSLSDIKDKINAVNTGTTSSKVTASIVAHASDNYHLILTSDETGADGLSVLEGAYSGGDNILQSMGFISAATAIKTATSDGAKSDLFTSSNGAIKTLLGLSNAPAATNVTIGGNSVSIDLSSAGESLTTIAQKIDALAGISAVVISEEVDGETKYRIDISGTTSFTDNGNILQTLGILEGEYGTEQAIHSQVSAANTDGDASTAITTGTLLTNIWSDGASSGVVAGDTITISGKRGDGTKVGTSGNDYKITFTVGAGSTVQNLLDQINNATDGFGAGTRTATASISNGKIIITDGTAGDSQLSLTLVANNQNGGTLDFGTISMDTEGRSMQVAQGVDAQIVVDNVTINKASNTITDVIAGTTLNLVGADSSTTVTVKVERDLGTIKSKINDLTDAFNTIMDYINTQFTYDEDNNKTGGILFGDGTLSSVKSELINMVTKTITGLSANYNRLPLIGITLDLADNQEGKHDNISLAIDDEMLTDALESNFNDVRNLFIAYGSGSSPYLSYIDHTSATQGGTYAVNITQEATRTTVTGSKELAGSLGEPVDVTIKDFATGRQATVSLGVSSNIDAVVNALNSQFAQEYTEVLTGSGATGQSASTLFSAVTGADNGDVITFSGIRRNGLSVSGSYTIVDKTTETVGDLLESIEDMFEDEVTAALDGSGKIVITDTQAGDSQLYFTIDTQSAGITGLDFGTVSSTTEGRYAMDITASKSGSNELVLTHNTYGTGHILVVSETSTTDPLGLDTATQVYGKDVAGTINGVSATGSGQSLTLASAGNNANGLSISYTGTTTTSATFTLTLGIAKLLDRQLGFITDISDGYVTYKQTSLQNSIDSFKTQIEQMEAQLDRKMEAMVNRFVAMEVALSKIQNQSQWLTGQINASLSGWWGK
uniref:Flagellar filament capping protein FliD n=1 Tax=Candidatus Desulfatibia profunda TaxID=2841695 RepID=A0A8J6NT72_9BACT|nr:flagellar filament capping protein FliD [Candidatus Desulfatibia profunda]